MDRRELGCGIVEIVVSFPDNEIVCFQFIDTSNGEDIFANVGLFYDEIRSLRDIINDIILKHEGSPKERIIPPSQKRLILNSGDMGRGE